MLRRSISFLCAAALSSTAFAQLVPMGATWKYLDDGSNQGNAWHALGFADGGWASGPAQLGYGDGDESTVVSFGGNANNKHVTTYFRHSFNVADPGAVVGLRLGLLRDDGVVVYLNGNGVVRNNMPAGAISFDTLASSTISGGAEEAIFDFFVDPANLVPGTNVLAAEIHQRSQTSSDISFDLILEATTTTPIMRGPYLQMGTANSVRVRWRTLLPTDSHVTYGSSPAMLTNSANVSGTRANHDVELSGLSPNTTYFYAVGSSSEVQGGGDADHFFVTSPDTGTVQPTRIWVLGDCGTASDNQRAVRDAYETFTGATHTNFVLLLGDNAYNSGSDADYQAAIFQVYGEMLRKTVFWSTRGNHESSLTTYRNIFSLPTAAEAGGVPSGTESYYSFDYGNIHFVCLDSQGSNRSVGGPMWTWLESDLLATDAQWLIAFWHHPPYSKGSHDSDTEGQLIDMRSNFLPLLESHGVDLVLSGHSHSYERSFLVDGHYGTSGTLTPAMILDGGDGSSSGDGAYQKIDGARSGAVYCVPGSAGRTSGGSLNHPVMHASLNQLGSAVIDLDAGGLTLRFLRSNGTVNDNFTMQSSGRTLCYGDGSGTPCPCGNDSSTPGEGCVTSTGAGMTIEASGSMSISSDDMVLTTRGVPVNNTGIYYSGTGPDPLGHTLFDGLQCINTGVLRYQGKFAATGVVTDTGFVGQDPFGLYFVSGTTYSFQYFTRDNQAGPSPCGGFANLSPLFEVTMGP